MYYKLKDNFVLRGWDKLPYAVVNKEKNKPVFLQREMFEAISLCNGRIDLDVPLVSDEVRKHIPELLEKGFIEQCQKGGSIAPEQEYRRYPSRYISIAHWSITGKCNYLCKHCFLSAPNAEHGELPHDTIMDIIRQLAECGVMNVSITGGEPLIRSDFFEIIDELLKNGIHITQIYSNGWLVNEKLLKELDKRGIHPEFNMSYDAPGWHDWMRGVEGAEKAVDRAFSLCREYGFPTGAEMCIHELNKHLLRETVNHLAELGCSSLKICPVSNEGEWKKHNYKTISSDEAMQLYLDYIPRYYEDGMPLRLQLGGLFQAVPAEPDHFSIPSAKSNCSPETTCLCGHARNVLYISPESRALPCMPISSMDVQEKFPLITETGLANCLNDSFYMDFIDSRVSKFLELHDECRKCEYMPYCMGGCRASALSFHEGDLMAIDDAVCDLFKKGWALKLIKLMQKVRPEATCSLTKDEFWKNKLK